jgi:hypothetical protein
MRELNALKKRKDRGQTALETAFVFSTLLFLTFTIVNFAILFHTKNIATYAAFMAGRSYQVLGDQTGADFFKESSTKPGIKPPNFLSDLGKTVAAFRVAEDVFTCSLPWMKVPSGDELVQLTPQDIKSGGASRCLEGKRKYQKTNIGKSLNFAPFKKDPNPLNGGAKLDEVAGSFTEKGRAPLRYGILNLKYRTPLLYNPMGVFAGISLVQSEAHVPILLNPGLEAGLQKKKDNEKDFEDEKK